MKFIERTKNLTERSEEVVEQIASIYKNQSSLESDVIVSSLENAMMIGPLTIPNNKTVTVDGTLTII